MTSTPALDIFLPLALGLVMLGLGLKLTPDDFRRVRERPRAVFIGLGVQMFLLPIVAWLLALGLPPGLGVGMMLLAASPGGPTANLYSSLAGGDVALNLTLTAINSLIAVVWVPIVVQLSVSGLLGADQQVPLQTAKVLQVLTIVVLPVAIGMLLRHKQPAFTRRVEGPVRVLSVLVLVALVVGLTWTYSDRLMPHLAQCGLAVLIFNLASLGLGWWVPRLAGLEPRQAVAISLEIGIHNGTLAIAVALQVLNLPDATIAPALYSLLAYFTAAAVAWWSARTLRNAA
jgi:BASS family bile acid:Na+ symporter